MPRVGVDAAVAQERPVAAHLLHAREVHLADQDLLLVGRRLGDHDAEGIGDERRAPELEPGPPSGGPLVADAVHRRDVDAVGDGVASAGWSARRRAGAAPYSRLLVRVPADRGRVEEHGGARERGEARAFRIPLVPADQRADAARPRVEGAEAEVAGREVELLVEERVVRDVHLAVQAERARRRVEDDRGVVVEARRAPLEERRDDRHARFLRAPRRAPRCVGPGIGSARSKSAASSRWQKYGERNSSGRQTTCGAGLRRLAHAGDGPLQVRGRVARTSPSARDRRGRKVACP